jgi:hypothetical protein
MSFAGLRRGAEDGVVLGAHENGKPANDRPVSTTADLTAEHSVVNVHVDGDLKPEPESLSCVVFV